MANKLRYQVDAPQPAKVTEIEIERVELTDNVGKGIGRFVFRQKKVERDYPETYTVYFLSGHITRFLTKEAMEAAGIFLSGGGHVDDETGLPADGPAPTRSIKEKALARTIDRSLGV